MHGLLDLYFKNYDELIVGSKPVVQVKNILFGGIYIDMDKSLNFISQKTGALSELNFHPKTSSHRSHVTGAAYNKEGKKMFSIEGSWTDELRLRDMTNNKVEIIWKAPPLEPDANMQFFFTPGNCLLNY